jgi:CRP-like cAMP-binding protein
LNQVLAALPAGERQEFIEACSSVALRAGAVLLEPGQEIDKVYFPTRGVISLVAPLSVSTIVEVAAIGNEGIVGVPLASVGPFLVRAIAVIASACIRIDASVFAEWYERNRNLRLLVDGYAQVLFGQVAQTAACNRLHSSEERLSRWLLMARDRVGADDFVVTQELLRQMLGARRSTVSVSAGILQRAGIIRYPRGHLTIVDHVALERVTCECYEAIRSEVARVGRPVPPR